MRRPCRQRRRQDGLAAIELALILLFFMALLPVVLLFSRVLLAYTALQKSTHDAARYMATLPLTQMTNADAAALNVMFARQMVLDAMKETLPSLQIAKVDLSCEYDDSYPCGNYAYKPQMVRIKVGVDLPVTFLPTLMRMWLPQLSSIPLRSNATLRYDN